jgi:hypothetical protein
LKEVVGFGYADIQAGVMLAGGEDAEVHGLVVLDGAPAVGAVFEFYDGLGGEGGPDGAAATGAEMAEGRGGIVGVVHIDRVFHGELYVVCEYSRSVLYQLVSSSLRRM